ncbi:hypothetical protein GCM10011583_48160 [Streptomyces camponoticapitis]|uniref:HTH arsR-type domain-containing protein n=1 Tax=Streptomyces camponoticapitis TaxID=1616125 RepID=A0ABQ2EI64_9ACTN|nr:hypothetical protein GCM10011583_48160 [Streptomyces camponoticapitis]
MVDLTTAMGMAQSSVSAHLAVLRECGLVVARPEARQMFYSLAHPDLPDLLTSSAEKILETTGSAEFRPDGEPDTP